MEVNCDDLNLRRTENQSYKWIYKITLNQKSGIGLMNNLDMVVMNLQNNIGQKIWDNNNEQIRYGGT